MDAAAVMLRRYWLQKFVIGCAAFGLAGCVIPGGGTYYQPNIPEGKTVSDASVAAGHKNIAKREFDGLKIKTSSWEKGKFLHVEVGFGVEESHSLAANFGLAEIESKYDGKVQRLSGTQPMVHVVSREMSVQKNDLIGGGKAGYTLYFDVPKPAPEEFVVVIPDIRLDGKQLGPLRIAYHRKNGVWLYWFSM